MKFEQSEQLLINDLYMNSFSSKKIGGEIVSIERLTGDASTRRYYRLKTELTSFVVCVDDPFQAEKDYAFWVAQKVLDESGVRVPKIYDCVPEKGYLLEEDLGDETMLKHLSKINGLSDELSIYKRALAILGKIHNIHDSKITGTAIKNNSFDMEKLMYECDFAIKHFVEGILGCKDTLAIQEMRGDLSLLCKKLANRKMVPTHRDYHSRNLMVKNNDLVVIDFQDARMGIPQYDVTSLLEDCYYQLDVENKKALIRLHWEEYCREDQTWDEYIDYYSLMKIQRLFKAIGSFSFIYNVRKDSRYLKYIGQALENMKGDLFQNSELVSFRKRLLGLYYAS